MKQWSEYRRRFPAMIVAVVMLVTLLGGSYPIAADEVTDAATDTAVSADSAAPVTTTYSQYITAHQEAAKPQATIAVSGMDVVADPEIGAGIYQNQFGSAAGVEVGSDAVKLTYTVEVAQTGLYNLVLTYYALPENTADILLELLVDGTRPFTEAGSLNFGRVYTDDEIQKDAYGNDVEPNIVQVPQWITQYAYDVYGGSGEYYFYLTAGTHELSFVTQGVPFLLEGFTLTQKADAPTYEEYLQQWKDAGATDASDFQEKYQAEDLLEKSDSSILVSSDRSNALMEPFAYETTRINILNGAQWTTPGQWVSWEVEVEESGFYTLGFKYRQNYLDGLFSSRKILIDGETPFQELEAVPFDYTNNWKSQVAGESEPYRIYLTAGKHVISMENVTGDLSQTIDTLQTCIDELNELYLEIMMITGSDPDPNRDYYLKKTIPNITERFTENANAILAEMQRLADELGMKGSETATYENVAYQLLSYGENVASLTNDSRLSTFQSDIVTLSSKLATLQGQGLDLDYITLSSPDKVQPRVKQNFWEWLTYTWKTFITSFTYREPEEAESSKADLEVWIVGGSDQLQIVEKIVDGTFTQQHNIGVDVKLAPGTLLQATASGLAPDVALNVDAYTPVNFALRGALVNLAELDGFKELKAQYIEGSFDPFTMDDVVFAVPATQSFSMMFVRDDVLQGMGLSAPKTWEELLDIAPVIQRHNMQIGVGTVSTTTLGSAASVSVFAEVLYQSGGSYYNEELSEVMWDENVAVKAFELTTSFFTDYSFPTAYDAVTRFRTGEMPIFISSYSTYNNIRYTAPEIDGLWSMNLIPGVEDENGTIHHTVVCSGANASVIFASTDNLTDAWTFLKWWGDGETQADYGNRLEARLGISSRYATANREAFDKLQWTKSELDILYRQMNDMVVLPILPGYYYVNRGISNSFNAVVVQGENPREVLLKWTNLVNEELARKQKEFDKNN